MTFEPGTLVAARGRDWVVLPDSTDEMIVVRPLGGLDDDIAALLPSIEDVAPATFPPPTADDLGGHTSAALLRSALRIGFRSTAGPFRSLGSLAVEPRAYQLVPLLMALRQETVRLLIADDVGIGKTVEAALIAAELLALGDAQRMTVLCSPSLAEQWRDELREKFGIEAELVLPSTVRRLERQLTGDESLFEHFPVTVVSTDFIKSERRRYEFQRTCPDLVIIDEAHTAVSGGGLGGAARTQRHELVKSIADDPTRHMILVTATPHSGNEEAFRNLLGLLDPELAVVNLEDVKGRELLAQHFVQRRRGDIRKYLDEDTPFPKDRQTQEVPYSLSPEYRRLFDSVLDYARGSVKTEGSAVQQRVSYWSALALLRAMASSPRAAAQTLATRAAKVETPAQADAIGRSVVLDHADDEAVESADATPAADDTEEGTSERRKLQAFRKAALELEGAPDAKLDQGIKVVKELLKDGFNPIVFCRFIDTAKYVAEAMGQALGKKVTVELVTGELPPEERSDRIDALADVSGEKVLIATDCLSEGVNLQHQFQAVVHYDLAWNPTRHEQREGRVDRFGQTSQVVRAITLFGQDNQIDGLVLDVLIRKHERIRKATGVSVPVPDNSHAVVEALMEGLLLRSESAEQLVLDFGLDKKAQALDAEWQSAAEREKSSQTKYAQHSIHPEEIAKEVAEARAGTGTREEVAEFVESALRSLGSRIQSNDDGFDASILELPVALRDALPSTQATGDTLRFVRDFPAERDEAVLNRADQTVLAVAANVLEAALDPTLDSSLRPGRRCAVIRTSDVTIRTTLLLVRYRLHVTLPSRFGDREIVAEDAVLVAFEGAPANAVWLSDEASEALLHARPTGNVVPAAAVAMAERMIDELPAVHEHLNSIGDELATKLQRSHKRVRESSGNIRRGLEVRVERPADVLGVYVYLPEVTL